MARARHGSYLFQRDGSANWWIKLRAGGKRLERSLGTCDRREAEVLALPLIAEHKATLFAARPRVETRWQHEYQPGREHVSPGGNAPARLVGRPDRTACGLNRRTGEGAD